MKRFLVALLPLCLLCTTLSYAQDWIQIHSQNLRMIANSDSKTAANVLWNLEEVRTHFGHMLNRNKVYRNRPILVLGLRGDAEVRALAGGKPTLPGGFALSAPNRDYLVIDLPPRLAHVIDQLARIGRQRLVVAHADRKIA